MLNVLIHKALTFLSSFMRHSEFKNTGIYYFLVIFMGFFSVVEFGV